MTVIPLPGKVLVLDQDKPEIKLSTPFTMPLIDAVEQLMASGMGRETAIDIVLTEKEKSC